MTLQYKIVNYCLPHCARKATQRTSNPSPSPYLHQNQGYRLTAQTLPGYDSEDGEGGAAGLGCAKHHSRVHTLMIGTDGGRIREEAGRHGFHRLVLREADGTVAEG